MNFLSLLNDSCTVLNRSVSTGKVKNESWTDGPTVRCRVLKQAISPRSTPNVQRSTIIRTRFTLDKLAPVSIRDRIRHGGRLYDVIEVTNTLSGAGPFHTVAICEGVAGDV